MTITVADVREAVPGHDGTCSLCPARATVLTGVWLRHPSGGLTIPALTLTCADHLDVAAPRVDRLRRSEVRDQLDVGYGRALWAAVLDAWPAPVQVKHPNTVEAPTPEPAADPVPLAWRVKLAEMFGSAERAGLGELRIDVIPAAGHEVDGLTFVKSRLAHLIEQRWTPESVTLEQRRVDGGHPDDWLPLDVRLLFVEVIAEAERRGLATLRVDGAAVEGRGNEMAAHIAALAANVQLDDELVLDGDDR